MLLACVVCLLPQPSIHKEPRILAGSWPQFQTQITGLILIWLPDAQCDRSRNHPRSSILKVSLGPWQYPVLGISVPLPLEGTWFLWVRASKCLLVYAFYWCVLKVLFLQESVDLETQLCGSDGFRNLPGLCLVAVHIRYSILQFPEKNQSYLWPEYIALFHLHVVQLHWFLNVRSSCVAWVMPTECSMTQKKNNSTCIYPVHELQIAHQEKSLSITISTFL